MSLHQYSTSISEVQVWECFEMREMVKTPKPGKPVRGSQTGRPIMALLDLLGRRWTLRIIWELREEELSFLELQARCDAMSSSTLVQRLSELTEARIIQQEPATNYYRLSSEGIELLNSLLPLNEFAQRWAESLEAQQ